MRWLLLIYSVPSEPSRKRAFVWREIKRAGAVYLHDGVCALPQGEAAEAAFDALARRIAELEGHATLVRDAVLEPAAVADATVRMQAARAGEYAAISQEAKAFLGHIRRETGHRDLSPVELQELSADIAKLRRWYQKVQARDYTNEGNYVGVDGLLHRCSLTMAQLSNASSRQGAAR